MEKTSTKINFSKNANYEFNFRHPGIVVFVVVGSVQGFGVSALGPITMSLSILFKVFPHDFLNVFYTYRDVFIRLYRCFPILVGCYFITF